MEDDLKKNLFSIPLKSRGKPFLGLAQLSKIFSNIVRYKKAVTILNWELWGK
jgi:hypothetical protein